MDVQEQTGDNSLQQKLIKTEQNSKSQTVYLW